MSEALETLTSNDVLHTVRRGKLYAVRWRKAPTAADLNGLKDELMRTARTVEDIIYAGMSDEEMGVPDKELQRTMTKNTLAMLPFVAEFNLVLEGTSLQATVTRTFFRGMLTAARLGQRVAGYDFLGAPVRKIAIFDTPLAFAQNASPRLDIAAPALMEFFSRNKLMR